MGILKIAINEELTSHALEDLNCYGRLDVVKELLVNLLDESNQLDIKTLSMF